MTIRFIDEQPKPKIRFLDEGNKLDEIEQRIQERAKISPKIEEIPKAVEKYIQPKEIRTPYAIPKVVKTSYWCCNANQRYTLANITSST